MTARRALYNRTTRSRAVGEGGQWSPLFSGVHERGSRRGHTDCIAAI